ncbi:hypothetical protein E3Q22_00103 [Wallemia mellicola]|uniref:DUF803-domain-containing protein n=1 Tax=Wallemia mellicola TaxID=1708541 RepID=A0A4T0MHE4_9BASI|nr:hypothetical protein E3Q22_00103 [Wallemia mellicola]
MSSHDEADLSGDVDKLTSNTSSAELPNTSDETAINQAKTGSQVGSFFIGLVIILIASIMNSIGLNIVQKDHLSNQSLPKDLQKRDLRRPLWFLGMSLYILSQLLGSTLALQYMRAEFVAPLGSTNLIFNFLIANYMLNIPITKRDIQGTLLIVVGVIGIVGFGSVNDGISDFLDINVLIELWGRLAWLLWFFILLISTFSIYVIGLDLEKISRRRADESGYATPTTDQQPTNSRIKVFLSKFTFIFTAIRAKMFKTLENIVGNIDDPSLKKVVGLVWAIEGGIMASECLILAKATVKLVSTQFSHNEAANQFAHPLFILTILLLATTAIGQIICLNKALALFDTTMVVPIFYGLYTSIGFINTLIFMNQLMAFRAWVLWCIGFSTILLLSGVYLLSAKKPSQEEINEEQTNDEIPLNVRSSNRDVEASHDNENKDDYDDDDDVVWDIGEASDEDNHDEQTDVRKPLRKQQPENETEPNPNA